MSSNTRETHIETLVNDYNYSNKNGRSIIADLEKYQFNDDIKLRSNLIYNKMKHSARRANKRQFLLFFCVYNAYKELGINVNPAELGRMFGLTQGQVQKTDSIFS